MLLEQDSCKITFFVVGADAAIEEHGPALQSLVPAGHEVGNHSFEHEPWLARYIARAARGRDRPRRGCDLAATGQRPIGFRGPGYSWSPELLEILSERGYLYDASTLPTYLGPLARAYYFRTAQLSDGRARGAQRSCSVDLRDGLRPSAPTAGSCRRPHAARDPGDDVAGHQGAVHLSYLLYLSRFSEAADGGVPRHRVTRVPAHRHRAELPAPSARPARREQEPRLAFFPGMDVPARRKVELFERAMQMLRRAFHDW